MHLRSSSIPVPSFLLQFRIPDTALTLLSYILILRSTLQHKNKTKHSTSQHSTCTMASQVTEIGGYRRERSMSIEDAEMFQNPHPYNDVSGTFCRRWFLVLVAGHVDGNRTPERFAE
mmetsp:Transcript_34426/g.63279  ORF Transcript_34426/g.63279 Transcript_34426/m.63279 type:complete len:117 (-) Transcript_34426:566-916(-)